MGSVPLVFTTKDLGDVGAGRSCEIGGKAVDHLLGLSDGVPDERPVNDQVRGHRVLQVLSSEQGVSSDLPMINARRVTNALPVHVSEREEHVAIVLPEATSIELAGHPGEDLSNGIDRDGLRVGESQDGLHY